MAPRPAKEPLDPAPTRAKVVDRFARALGGDAGASLDAGALDALAKRLEICLWNRTIVTCTRDRVPCYWDNPRVRYRYTTKALGLEYNVRHNASIRERLVSRELAPKAFVGMQPQEMWPERWEGAYQKVAMKQLRREADVDASSAPDGAYTCSRCKSRKTVYTSMQIRSADEPMTNFVRCLNCGKNWKD